MRVTVWSRLDLQLSGIAARLLLCMTYQLSDNGSQGRASSATKELSKRNFCLTDTYLSQSPQLSLVQCGSISSMNRGECVGSSIEPGTRNLN
jgi:hypothetical protein